MSHEFRAILWKESYLVRRLVYLLVALGVLGLAGIFLEGNGRDNRVWCDFISVLCIGISFAFGAMMFAGETEYDTHRLLHRLGASPRTIWQGKLLVALSGIVVLRIVLLITAVILYYIALKVSNPYVGYRDFGMTATQFWAPWGLALEGMLLGMFFSSLTRKVLAALAYALITFVGIVFIQIIINSNIANSRFFGEMELSLIIHAAVVILLIILNVWSISRWFDVDQRSQSFSFSLSEYSFLSRIDITTYFHECSSEWKFASRLLWCELRQHGYFWMFVMLIAVLLEWRPQHLFRPNSEYSASFCVVPWLMGIASCYREQTKERARFWYQRGVSAWTFWSCKNLIWLTVAFLIWWGATLLNQLVLGSYASEISNNKTIDGNPIQFSTNVWYSAILIYLISQWAVLRIPQIIFAVIVALNNSIVAMMVAWLCHISYVPLSIVFPPLILGMAWSSYRFCADSLRDLSDPGNKQRWVKLVMPIAVLLSCIFFCRYRYLSVPKDTNYVLSQPAAIEETLQSTDQAYSDRIYELDQSMLGYQELENQIQHAISTELGDLNQYSEERKAKQQEIRDKFFEQAIKQNLPMIKELMAVLQRRHQSGQSMKRNMLEYWRPEKRVFETGADTDEIDLNVYDYGDANLSKTIRLMRTRDWQDFDCPVKEQIQFFWNLDESRSYMSGTGEYNLMAYPVSQSWSPNIYSHKNMNRLFEQEDSAGLRELVHQSIERELRIPSMTEIVDHWFAYAAYQIEHDDELFWKYVNQMFQASAKEKESSFHQFLQARVLFSSRWTLLSTEKERAKRLLSHAYRFYQEWALRIDLATSNDVPLNHIREELSLLANDWKIADDPLHPWWASTPAVRDFGDPTTLHIIVNYGRIFEHHRLRTTALAMLAYAKDHGEYPHALDQLVPDYLDALPRDPWTANPFQYLPEDFKGILPTDPEGDLNYRYDEEDVGVESVGHLPMLWSRGMDSIELFKFDWEDPHADPPRFLFVSRSLIYDRVRRIPDRSVRYDLLNRHLHHGYSYVRPIHMMMPKLDRNESEN